VMIINLITAILGQHQYNGVIVEVKLKNKYVQIRDAFSRFFTVP